MGELKTKLKEYRAKYDMKQGELAEKVGMTNVNLSNLKTGKMKGIRFETMNAICEALECQPGDLFEHVNE